MADNSTELPPGDRQAAAEGKIPGDDEAMEEQANPVVVEDRPDEFESGEPLPYPVVGIGASAGGLEAYIELFNSLAPDTGMAYVLIPHLSADYKSHMVDILGRHTPMPVVEIESGMRPEENRVHILPPNARIRMDKGAFVLEGRDLEGVPHPIDYFFHSLAATQKTRAIGVVLSGTDSDGALGLKAIKGEGGITLVQSPESARFADMPRSSIAVEHVDKILPPSRIAAELAQIGRQFHEPEVRTLEAGEPQSASEQHFNSILHLLRGVSGVDFRLYTQTTLRRRIARRMLLHRIQTLGEYAGYLQGNVKELRDLQEDALINVTRFFRDEGVFEALRQTILPRVLEGREPDQHVRVWVAGCSSGEEAYSIAICLLEYLAGQPYEPAIQIFATDASEQNIQRARAGIFPESIVAEVSPERLRRFFVKVDRGYQVAKRVRDMCIFARQNLCQDAPFSNLDLISCRNVLIYFGAELQKQLLPTFHYALRPNGFLLLGTSETIREFTNLFQMLDRKNKLFVKTGDNVSRTILNIAPRLTVSGVHPASTPGLPETWGDTDLQRAADRIILARYGPAGVVIDEKLQILQSRGHTARYMELSPGAVSLQLTRMLHDSIAPQVSAAVHRAVAEHIPVRTEPLRLRDGEHESRITVDVLPIHTTARKPKCFLVLFVPVAETEPAPPVSKDAAETPAPSTLERDQLVQRLRQDVSVTKLYLETLLEEREAKNQELVSANEEIQSSNEEMQSTNEELETTKEELQSSNEELQTVNDALQQRNLILTQTTNDLTNLLNSVNLPLLMLSNELYIRHLTPQTLRLMNLRASDIGRPFSEIRVNLNIGDLAPLCRDVLETLAPREMQVQDREGCWYLLRVRPYRTADNKIDGVVIALLDIDQLRRSQLELQAARDFSASVIECVPLPLAVVDLEFRIQAVNRALRELLGMSSEDLLRHSLAEVTAAAWGLDEPLRTRLQQLRSSEDVGGHFEFAHQLPGDSSRVFSVEARALKPDREMFLMITIDDISARKHIERLQKMERDRLASEVASTSRELGRTKEELRALAASLFTSQEDERRRVARELHDDISQRLAALQLDAQGIVPRLTQDPARAAQDLEHVRTGIAALSEEVRRISHGLHPTVIDDLGIAAALRTLVEDFREREHMIVTFAAQDLPNDIPGPIGTGLYRIAQEALRNVSKHAGRTHVKVTLRGSPTAIRLQVIDFGEGFDVQERSSGLGLVSMEERARMMEAILGIASEPGEGTRITVEVPWPRAN